MKISAPLGRTAKTAKRKVQKLPETRKGRPPSWSSREEVRFFPAFRFQWSNYDARVSYMKIDQWQKSCRVYVSLWKNAGAQILSSWIEALWKLNYRWKVPECPLPSPAIDAHGNTPLPHIRATLSYVKWSNGTTPPTILPASLGRKSFFGVVLHPYQLPLSLYI